MQRDQDPSIQLVISKCVIGARRVAVSINECVMPHVLVAEPARLQDRADGTLELHRLPAAFEKSAILRIVWISTHKIRTCPISVEPDHIRQGRFEQNRFVRLSKIVQIKKRVDVLLGYGFCPGALRSNDLCFGHGFKITFRHGSALIFSYLPKVCHPDPDQDAQSLGISSG